MIQSKFSLTHTDIQFLEQFKAYGFKDKSDLVRAALNRLRLELELQSLQASADLYAELYQDDPETQSLTELARLEWPE